MGPATVSNKSNIGIMTISNFINLKSSLFSCSINQIYISDSIVWLLPVLLNDPRNFHPYVYAKNNAINKSDPLGLMSKDLCLGACRAGYFIVCSIICDPLIEVPPLWFACNIACLAWSEERCKEMCKCKEPKK